MRRAVLLGNTAGSLSARALAALALGLFCRQAAAEVVYLKNGDVIHGSVVAVTERRFTFSTPYGRLLIPKEDILRIEYGVPNKVQNKDEGAKESEAKKEPDLPPLKPASPRLSLEIRGRSFWYAFESPRGSNVDFGIRLRVFLGETEVATLLDTKPDTVDRSSYYNSFTFSPTDSQVLKTAEGFLCRVEESEQGKVVLRLDLPEGHREGQFLVRMVYQVNEGSPELPRWVDAVSRSFPVQVEAGKEFYVLLEQDAGGLEYSGFLRKSMRNLESFRLNVLSSEFRPIPPIPQEPRR